MNTHSCRLFQVVVAAALVGGCQEAATPGETGPTGRLSVAVAPLTLTGLTDAVYTITVRNGAGGSGSVVWTKQLSSTGFGDGAGSISYIGTCDASTGTNTVTIDLESLHDGDGLIAPAPTGTRPRSRATSPALRTPTSASPST